MTDPVGGGLSAEWVAAIAAVAALFVAGVQLRLQRTEQAKRERIAYAAIWAEHFRLWAKYRQWEGTDLVQRARNGTLDPTEIRPQFWDALLPMLGELGPEGAHYAGLAAVHAEDASLMAMRLINLAETERKVQDTLAQADDADGGIVGRMSAELAADLSQLENTLRANEARARGKAKRAADLFQDAINVSPLSVRREQFGIRGGASEDAKAFVEALKEREATMRRGWFAAVRHRISLWLFAVAERIDAPGQATGQTPPLSTGERELRITVRE